MKLTVLTWLRDSSIKVVGRLIEFIFRAILFFLPLGVYLLLIQTREKVSATSSLSTFTTDNSRWQHVFPGFILVTINQQSLRKSMNNIKMTTQVWISSNKYIIEVIFMILVIAILIINGVF